jgi:branched-chain amino acid transport system permease protein
MTNFFQYVVSGLSIGSIFAVIGMSFVLVFRTTGIVNFAQGAFAVLGSFLSYWLWKETGLPLWSAMILALPLVALVGTLVAVLAMGVRGRTTPFSSLVVTLGAGFLIEAFVLLKFGEGNRPYPGISSGHWEVRGVTILPQYVLIASVAVVAAVGLTFLLRHTIVGQALVACSDSVRAAELVGLNVRSIAVVAFALAGILSAVAGILINPIQATTYNSDVEIAINGFAAAVFGGLASIRLALLGGYVFGIAEEMVKGYIDTQYNLAAALVILLVLIAWRSRNEIAT